LCLQLNGQTLKGKNIGRHVALIQTGKPVDESNGSSKLVQVYSVLITFVLQYDDHCFFYWLGPWFVNKFRVLQFLPLSLGLKGVPHTFS